MIARVTGESNFETAEPMGEAAWILRGIRVDPTALAKAIRGAELPGIIDAVASYDTVGVFVDPSRFHVPALDSVGVPSLAVIGKTHVIPVCYEMGEDLVWVAEQLSISTESLIQAHSAETYRCFAVGFCPGFPYLGWLPSAIEGIPRLAFPRVRVPAGSIGITGRQTGVYPLVRPGGWPLIGRTPLTLVDPSADYFPIEAGDDVRFKPISAQEFQKLEGERL